MTAVSIELTTAPRLPVPPTAPPTIGASPTVDVGTDVDVPDDSPLGRALARRRAEAAAPATAVVSHDSMI